MLFQQYRLVIGRTDCLVAVGLLYLRMCPRMAYDIANV